jgi:hypothetical protein
VNFPRKSSLPYVFIIGFNKTGTTALHYFFEKNGWPSVHWDRGNLASSMLLNALSGRKVLSGYDKKFRVFSDLTYDSLDFRFEANSLFPLLDRQYPGSFFILNTRDIESWIESRKKKVLRRFKLTYEELEARVSGLEAPSVAADKWRHNRMEFEERVIRYFRGSERFLLVDIDDSDVPRNLSRFLDFPFDLTHWHKIRTN